jgi:putative MATE family efflux protein
MQGIKNLTEGRIFKQLFNLAMPIMATSFIQMAYSLINMAWVGRIGSEAVAAIGTVGILSWMSASISLLNKVGSEVSVGQAIGAKDEAAAKKFAAHNITIALIISLCWGTLLFVFAHPIIGIYELNSEISANAIVYLRIISAAMPFIFLSTAFTGIYNAAGRSKVPFYITGSGLIVNMILDPIFIFVFNWGTTGAAIATFVSQGIVFGLFIYQLKGKKDILGGFALLTKLQRSYTRRIFKLGLPAATLNTLFAFVNMYLCRLASEQGGHIGLMTLTMGGQIEAITWNTSQGFSSALGAFISQNYAAGKHDRVLRSYKATLWMTSIFGSFCTLLFIFFGQEIFSVFVPELPAMIAGGIYLRISGYSQLFMMMEITTQGLFYGTGRTLPPAIISITCNYLRIPIALVLTGMGMGVAGIWWAISGTSIAKGVFASIWFAVIKKRILKSL